MFKTQQKPSKTIIYKKRSFFGVHFSLVLVNNTYSIGSIIEHPEQCHLSFNPSMDKQTAKPIPTIT
jgi:hypothetical protein